jgi:acyl-ACP thioesterase
MEKLEKNNLENYFDKEFELRYFEMDKTGIVSPTTILTLIEETAADHCYSIDASLFDLEKQQIGWVLLGGYMQMERYPNYKEKINIRTWLSEYSLVKGFRENIIYDEHENIIGRAKGIWLFFDIKKRKPVQIFDYIKQKWNFCKEVCIVQDITKKIEELITGTYKQEYNVNRFDTDSNKHVNNIRYLQWALESVPDEIISNYFLHRLDGRFIGEAQYGDKILSIANEGVVENSFIHTIKVLGSNKVCATAKTLWKKIER